MDNDLRPGRLGVPDKISVRTSAATSRRAARSNARATSRLTSKTRIRRSAKACRAAEVVMCTFSPTGGQEAADPAKQLSFRFAQGQAGGPACGIHAPIWLCGSSNTTSNLRLRLPTTQAACPCMDGDSPCTNRNSYIAVLARASGGEEGDRTLGRKKSPSNSMRTSTRAGSSPMASGDPFIRAWSADCDFRRALRLFSEHRDGSSTSPRLAERREMWRERGRRAREPDHFSAGQVEVAMLPGKQSGLGDDDQRRHVGLTLIKEAIRDRRDERTA